MSESKIVVYTMTGCQHCAGVKAYLDEKGVEYTERNVLEDEGAMEEFQALGFRGTPVTMVGDEAIVGLDRAKFDALLGGANAGGA
jgi:glutaredoxin